MQPQKPQQSAFDYLESYQQKIDAGYKVTAFDNENSNNWVGLSFLSGNGLFLTAINEVYGILSVIDLTPLPGVKPWVRGLSSYRGEIFTVTDLSGLLQDQLSSITKNSRILLVESEIGLAGLLIDRILGLQRISNQNYCQHKVLGLSEHFEPFLTGSIKVSSSNLPIISCQAIIKNAQYQNIRSHDDPPTG